MKNSNHASKALAVVLSGALAFAPAANAALDESNMAYTSASEGFYGSLRVQYENNDAAGGKDNDSEVAADDSRLGVSGSADLGSGLEAFYGFEWNLGDAENGGGGLNTRQHHVGLRGDWGSVWLGAFDSVIVRFGGFATTDILDQYSGNFEPIYRASNAVAYVSPDLNGFQFGVEVAANDGTKAETILPGGSLPVPGATVTFTKCEVNPNGPIDIGELDGSNVCDGNAVRVSGDPDDGNDFDKIGFGASYSIQGLTFSGAYYQEQDALPKGRYLEEVGKDTRYEGYDDNSRYALGLSYNQDNWIVAAMYGGQDFASDFGCVDTPDATDDNNNQCNYRVSQIGDATFFSLAAGVSIDKLDIHGLWEQKTEEDFYQFDSDTDAVGGIASQDRDTTYTAISARYHLGSKARLRAAWLNEEIEEGNVSTDNTKYALGLRVDF